MNPEVVLVGDPIMASLVRRKKTYYLQYYVGEKIKRRSVGVRMAIRIAIMAITTNNSISVKALTLIVTISVYTMDIDAQGRNPGNTASPRQSKSLKPVAPAIIRGSHGTFRLATVVQFLHRPPCQHPGGGRLWSRRVFESGLVQNRTSPETLQDNSTTGNKQDWALPALVAYLAR